MADEFLSSFWTTHESKRRLQQLTASHKTHVAQRPEDTGRSAVSPQQQHLQLPQITAGDAPDV